MYGSIAAEQHATKLMLDHKFMTDADLEQIVQRAREIWVMHYGGTRVCHAARMDKGVSRPSKRAAPTEIDFLRKRRRAVVEAASATPRVIDLDADDADEDDMPKHKKEKEFNRQKLMKKKIDAFQRSTLLDPEVTDDLQRQAADAAQHQARLDHRRITQEKRLAKEVDLGRVLPLTHFAGCKFFVDSSVDPVAVVEAVLEQAGLTKTTQRSQAKVVMPMHTTCMRICVSIVRR